MTPYRKRVTAFTKRMAEDMQLRNMSPRTIDAYTYHVDRFALRFGKHPEELGHEHVREFQLWMINELKCSWSQFNQAVSALRFFYSVTCKRDWVVRQVPYGKRPKKLPVVLGNDEVARIIACVRNIKHRTVLITLYSAGLRISEALNLRVSDIDSQRMMLKITQAKGLKDRYVPLSPRLLKELMYDLLFRTAWQSLQAKIQNELGIQAAGLAVLHTWNQELGHHPHVHMMVPGNGPSLDGRNWVECRLTKREAKPFLVDNKELGRDFRDLFLAELERVACSGELQLADSGYIADLIGDLRLINWNVFIEGPPKPECPPERMLKYLTRYLTGGPISDKRIVGEKDGRVWFMARRQDNQPGQRLTSLPNVEFVRRWAIHVLPKEFTKVRQFGHWASTKRSSYLRACAANFEQFQASRSSIADAHAMDVDSSEINGLSEPLSTSITPSSNGSTVSTELLVPAVMAIAAVAASDCTPAMQADLNVSCATTCNNTASSSITAQSTKEKRCPHCQQALQCIAEQPRPAWRELFYGPEHPWWFEWTSLGQRPPTNEQLESMRQTSVAAQPTQASPHQPIAQDIDEHLETLEQPDIFDQIIAQNLAMKGET